MPTITPLCHHIKTNGVQCHSPSLRDGSYCYFHDRHHNFRIRKAPATRRREYNIPLHLLDSPESIQFALSQVINALALGDISCDRASALLYGIQLASSNLCNLPHVVK
jgi:hypothetical protein